MSINNGVTATYMRAYVSAMTACAAAADAVERTALLGEVTADLPMPHVSVTTDDEGQMHLSVDFSEVFLAAVVLLNYLATLVSDVTGEPEEVVINGLGLWVAEFFPEDGNFGG